MQQLSNEVALLKSLVHPSIVKYEGLVRSEHYLNIILEYVENGSLEKTLKTFGELPEQLVASYILRVLEGLIYLHSQNVVHCDLKGEFADSPTMLLKRKLISFSRISQRPTF